MKLTFVTGKGGVGKSAITASLASVLAALKFKVCIVELGESRMADFFEVPPSDYEGIVVNPHISLLNLDAKSCFEEYAQLHLPKQAFHFLKNKWIHHFIDSTPGLNEILLLGKIATLVNDDTYDLLLIDAPATGHTISLCDAPRIALQALKHGPLKSTVGKIWDLLHDPKQTTFFLVSQLEDFIVQETVELYEYLTKTLGLAPKGILVNGVLKEEQKITKKIPDGWPPEAKPLVEMMMTIQEKQKRQQKLLSQLKKGVSNNVTELSWEELITKESQLRQHLATQLKPWALKNYSIEKA